MNYRTFDLYSSIFLFVAMNFNATSTAILQGLPPPFLFPLNFPPLVDTVDIPSMRSCLPASLRWLMGL